MKGNRQTCKGRKISFSSAFPLSWTTFLPFQRSLLLLPYRHWYFHIDSPLEREPRKQIHPKQEGCVCVCVCQLLSHVQLFEPHGL